MSKNKYVNLWLKYCALLPTFVCLNTWSLFLDISLCALLISRPSYMFVDILYNLVKSVLRYDLFFLFLSHV